MGTTAVDFAELVRALEEHPEWRAELRRLLLPEALLQVPDMLAQVTATLRDVAVLVGHLAEGQRQAQQELAQVRRAVAALAERQRRTEEELAASRRHAEEAFAALAEAQRRTEEELAAFRREADERFAALAEAQRRTEETVAGLVEAQRRTEQLVAQLLEAQQELARRQDQFAETQSQLLRRVDRLEERVGRLVGESVERRYRERAAAYFGRWLTGVRVLDGLALSRLLDQAVGEGRLSWDERVEVLLADAVLRGRDRQGREVVLLVEASATVDEGDVQRAVARAGLLGKGLGVTVVPVVAGEEVAEGVVLLCEQQGVWLLQDGHTTGLPSTG